MNLGMVWVLVGFVLVAENGQDKDVDKNKGKEKTDLAALQGSWQIVGKEFKGKKATKQEVEGLKGEMVIKDTVVTQWANEGGKKFIISKATFKLDPKAKPKGLELTYTSGDLKGKTLRAIYELKGDTLRVCFSMRDEQRPSEFAGKADGKAFLLTYKRVKK
jgi:uncharacterized protein (TIGR03067 family)